MPTLVNKIKINKSIFFRIIQDHPRLLAVTKRKIIYMDPESKKIKEKNKVPLHLLRHIVFQSEPG